jgi:IMP and pyridine-specific 5'-nucleotidase
VGLVPNQNTQIPREALDETVLTLQDKLSRLNASGPVKGIDLPRCIFNGGTDAWCDVGNKRVGVLMLQSYLGVQAVKTLHIGDQFLNTGNDYAARDVCPCIWITSPDETTYILKSILRLAGCGIAGDESKKRPSTLNFTELERRSKAVKVMDVYTGEMITKET